MTDLLTSTLTPEQKWEQATLANNFLRRNHRFRRDSLKTLLKRFFNAPYLQNHGKRARNL